MILFSPAFSSTVRETFFLSSSLTNRREYVPAGSSTGAKGVCPWLFPLMKTVAKGRTRNARVPLPAGLEVEDRLGGVLVEALPG